MEVLLLNDFFLYKVFQTSFKILNENNTIETIYHWYEYLIQ